jgi:hypothetical protein
MDKDLKMDKLSEGNYQMWRFKVLSFLEDKDLDGLVTQEAQEDDEWKRKDKKARAIIKLTLSDDVIPFVVNAATTKVVWDELDARFNQNSWVVT